MRGFYLRIFLNTFKTISDYKIWPTLRWFEKMPGWHWYFGRSIFKGKLWKFLKIHSRKTEQKKHKIWHIAEAIVMHRHCRNSTVTDCSLKVRTVDCYRLSRIDLEQGFYRFFTTIYAINSLKGEKRKVKFLYIFLNGLNENFLAYQNFKTYYFHFLRYCSASSCLLTLASTYEKFA